MKEKTTLELMEEKEVMIKKYDQMIYESSQKSMAESRKAREKRMIERKKYEDDGWNSSYINPTQPEPEPEPKPKPKHKHIHKKVEEPTIPINESQYKLIDPKELEIARLKTLLAEKELAVKEEEKEVLEELAIEAEAEVIEEVQKEEGE